VDETEAPAPEPTRSTPDDHDGHDRHDSQSPDDSQTPDDVDDLMLAALLRQAARLRAIELQLDAVFDLRSHAQAMRQAADADVHATGRADTA
jgi:hypothetical protein